MFDEMEQMKEQIVNMKQELQLLRMNLKAYHMDMCRLLEAIEANTRKDTVEYQVTNNSIIDENI